MSTLRTVNIQHPSSSTPSITMDSTGAMTGSFPYPNRNLIYNGAMQVSQRGTSTASITGGGYYTADRYQVGIDSLGTWTQSVENDAPTGSGFRKSLKMLCTTADASPAASDTLRIDQYLEGQDLQRIAKGTSSAQQLTMSFWVKSNVTGTYIVWLYDNDNARQVSASYTISASATWERKTITFPADTTGAFDNDNAASLLVSFILGAGSSFTSGTLATTWAAASNANRAVGQTNLAASTNNYWQITGVQLETGSVATPFEFKNYGQDLRECQRYYWRSNSTNAYASHGWARAVNTTTAYVLVSRSSEMRVPPTSVEFSNLGLHIPTISIAAVTNIIMASTSASTPEIAATSTGLTAGTVYLLSNNNNAAGYLALSAEL